MTVWSETERMVLDTTERLLVEQCPPEVAAEPDGESAKRLADAVRESGVALACVPETLGGAGCKPELAYRLMELAGRHALPGPLPETLAANQFLTAAGMEPRDSAAIAYEIEPGNATAAYAAACDWVVAVAPGGDALTLNVYAMSDLRIEAGRSIANEPWNRVNFTDARPKATGTLPATVSADGARAALALVRAHQIAGALDATLALTGEYVSNREQFGRALVRFQAIQAMVADLAGATAMTHAAVDHAARSARETDLPDLSVAATAKVIAASAAGRAARLAHQAHGAMGFSAEYPLSIWTRRLWHWRDADGSESFWARKLGQDLFRQRRRGAWSYLIEA